MSDTLVETQLDIDYQPDEFGGEHRSDQKLDDLQVEYQPHTEEVLHHPVAEFDGNVDVLSDLRKLAESERNPGAIEYVRNQLRTEMDEAVLPFKKSEVTMQILKEDGEVTDLEMGGYSLSEMLINGIVYEQDKLRERGIDTDKSIHEMSPFEYAQTFELRRRRQEYINLRFMLDNFDRFEEGQPFLEISPYPVAVDDEIANPYGYGNNRGVMRIYRFVDGEILCEQIKLPTDYEAFAMIPESQQLYTKGKDRVPVKPGFRDGTDLLAESGFVCYERGIQDLDQLLEFYFDGHDQIGYKRFEEFYAHIEEQSELVVEEIMEEMARLLDIYNIDDEQQAMQLAKKVIDLKVRRWIEFAKQVKGSKANLVIGVEGEEGFLNIVVDDVGEMEICGTGITTDMLLTEYLNPHEMVMRLMGIVDRTDSVGSKAMTCPNCGYIIMREGLIDGALVSRCPNPYCKSTDIACNDNGQTLAELIETLDRARKERAKRVKSQN